MRTILTTTQSCLLAAMFVLTGCGDSGSKPPAAPVAPGPISVSGAPSTTGTTNASSPSAPNSTGTTASNPSQIILRHNEEHPDQKVERLDQPTFERLRDLGYLDAVPDDPGQGPGTCFHYRMHLELGRLYPTCSVHGAALPLLW
ncbi:MAG: hypothetical protein HY814_10240 [Candidatus Riflebacteria bacterium]|nr:hypothetical protein [Candidatus Riflebacteria bacterium]